MFLSDISIKRPVFAGMMNLFVIIIGLLAYQKIGIDDMPKIDLPVVQVKVIISGATPQYIEDNVLNPIELGLRAIEGIHAIDSTASVGSVTVLATFDLSEDINVALNNVRNAMTSVTGAKTWPANAQTPIVKAIDPNQAPIIQVAIISDNPEVTPQELSRYINDVFIPDVEQVHGVGDASAVGLRLPEYQIFFSNKKLKSYNITSADVVQQVTNQITSLPGGQVRNEKFTFTIDSTTLPQSIQDLGNIIITLPGNKVVKLSEIAELRDSIQPLTTYGESDHKNAVIVYITKISQFNSVEVVDGLKKVIHKAQEKVAGRIQIRIVNDTSTSIKESIYAVKHDILLGALLTILIVFLFLHDWRATFVSAITIPTSVLGTIAVIQYLNFTLNSFTTLALSISVGIIVDDAIVVVENIHRHLMMGKKPFQATSDAMKEIALPAIAITIAIIAVFMPVAYMDGIIGRYFYEFATTISISVMISLFVAFTASPMIASRLLIVHKEGEHKKNFIFRSVDVCLEKLEDIYEKCISFTLKNRILTIGVALAVLYFSVFLLRFVPTIFQPKVDISYLAITAQFNANTSIYESIRRSQIIETWLKDYPGVDNVFFQINTNQYISTFLVNLVDPDQRSFTQQEFEIHLRKQIQQFKENEDERFTISKPGKLRQPLQIILSSADFDALKKYADEALAYFAKIEGVADPMTDASPPAEEIRFNIYSEIASSLGVSNANIANTISYLFYGQQVGSFNEASDSYEVMTYIEEMEALNPEDILQITVPGGPNMTPIPLQSVANIYLLKEDSTILHHNNIREITLIGEYTGKDMGGVIRKMQDYFKKTLPVQINYEFAGDAQNLLDSNKAIISALLLSILFAYMVLCSQFESFITPFAILLSVPLAFSGAFLGIIVSRETLSLSAMVGLILLTGLVKKNAILLLDFSEQKMREGLSREEGLKKAGKTRLRPILMTTFAMIFGMFPIVFSTGIGHELRKPMGVAVIGGLISSLILTLLVIPCVYSVFMSGKDILIAKMQRKK